MSEAGSDFRQALERTRSDGEAAVWEFIATYGPHIQRVVRRRLHRQLRSKFDSVDFVQMVWASFFADRERLARFTDADELIRYLVALARNKVIDESRRRLKYQKHSVLRECSLERVDASRAAALQRQATPSQIAIARERWQQLVSAQSERDRRIVELRMNGATFAEIGRTLGIHERTARHVIDSLATCGTDSV